MRDRIVFAAGVVLALLLVISCADLGRDNPNDPKSDKYVPHSYSSSDVFSSSSAKLSSSSAKSSSSVPPSSSSSETPITLLPCGTGTYNPETHFCLSGNTITERCGGDAYNEFQFCYPNNNRVYDKCNNAPYNPTTNGCCDNTTYSLARYGCCNDVQYERDTHGCCNNVLYALATQQFCYNNKIGSFCGTRPETFDPDLYECREGNKIYLKNRVFYGKYYEAVLIGTQTWMTENLNYPADGSKCGNSDDELLTENVSDCDAYGRLYDWATAMGISDDYNYDNYNSSSSAKHRGVCPSGWHIPSSAEWNALIKVANPTCNDYVDFCENAGAKLKATNGWGDGYNGINGTDDYGFAALPGGMGWDLGDFVNFYMNGAWWSADDDFSLADCLYLSGYYDITSWSRGSKTFLFSVRCVKD